MKQSTLLGSNGNNLIEWAIGADRITRFYQKADDKRILDKETVIEY